VTVKTLILVSVLVLSASFAFSQTQQAVSEQDWEKLYSALDNEDWKTAAELSEKYLKQTQTGGDKESSARLRYMLIFASAGRVGQREMTHGELGKMLTDFTGKELTLPGTTFSTKCPAPMNSFCISKDGDFNLSRGAANRAGTYIHAFEYVKLDNSSNLDKRDGEVGVVSGVLSGFQLNPNKSTIWIVRLFIEKGSVVFGNPKT
jgi:hypothetical protein